MHATRTNAQNCCCAEPAANYYYYRCCCAELAIAATECCRDARTSRMLEMVTTEALKKAKKAGMAKMPSHRLPHVKNVTIRMSREVVIPDAISSFERFFVSTSWPAATPLNAGMSPPCPPVLPPLYSCCCFVVVVHPWDELISQVFLFFCSTIKKRQQTRTKNNNNDKKNRHVLLEATYDTYEYQTGNFTQDKPIGEAQWRGPHPRVRQPVQPRAMTQ